MKEIQHKTKRTLMESNVPNMVELQLESYNWFLSKGIKELFRSFSPIKDHQESNKYSLELLDYELGKPKFTEEECRYRDNSTYERPIRIKCQLVVKDESGAIKEIIPETLYFGELPIMTDKGTFVINGAERVVVSQLTRSPGAYFEDNIDISGTMLYTGRIIPGNGCWLEVETDARGIMQAKLAQSDKFPLTVLLRAFSAISEACPVYLPSLIGKELPKDITNPVTGEPVFSCRKKNGKPAVFTKADYKRVKDLLTGLYKDENYRFREYVLSPDYIYDKELGQSTSTTLDILNIFGEKTFVPVERTFKCESFYHYADYNENGEPVVNPKTGEVIRDPYVVVPSKDPDPKTDKMLRVFKKDLYKFDPRGEKLIRIQGKYIKDADLEQIKADSVKETRRNFSEYSIEGMRPVKTVCARGGEDNPEIVLAEPEAYWPKVRELIADDADNPGIRTIEDAVRKIEADENVEILCLAGEMIDRDTAQKIFEIGAGFLEVYKLDPFISETLKCEQHRNYADYNAGARTHEILDAEEAISNFYIYMNSNKSIVEDRESSRAYLRNYIFDNRRYDLGAVGRYKINKKLLLDLPEFSNNNLEPIRSITRDDLIQLIKYIISLNQDGVIVYSFDAEKRDKALETVDEYIAKEEAATKQREVTKKLPGSRLGKLVRFRKMFAECRKGYMFSSADYAEFIDIASGIRFNISEDGSFVLDPEGSRRLDAIISNSPETLTELCAVKVKNCVTDEIDHLENKRVRSVGELLQDQLRGGFNKLQKVCQEKMGHPNTQNAANPKNQEKVTPGYLITNKPITSAIRSFFGSSQLSQFMEQTNPLAELTQKRKLSALGPGGLSRQSAKLEVRDVHSSHYGRICPVETPEGPNIGLIGSMAIQAKIDDFGFLKTPYRVVRDGKITNEIRELSADDETNEYIATANTRTNENGEFIDDIINVRYNGNYRTVEKSKITLIDVSPNQIMSVAANLIPFIENDDANRALMGSNMQRQAVPLLRPTAPIVRTGVEGRTAHDSGVEMLARRAGRVVWTSSKWILVNPQNENTTDTYTVYSTLRDGQKVQAKEAAVKLAYSRSKDKNSRFADTDPSDTVIAPVKRAGTVAITEIDGRKTIAVTPEDLPPAEIDFADDSYLKGVVPGDIIIGGKVYDAKDHSRKRDEEFGDTIEFNTEENKVPDGTVKKIAAVKLQDEDETSVYRLTVEECDYYQAEPEVIRSTFPADHVLFYVNEYSAKSVDAATGTGKDGRIEVKQLEPLKYSFTVRVCDSYRLFNMVRSNQNTCINSRPVVHSGDRVKTDQLLADGPCTDSGELALGQNVTVAFMPWNGFNYEDAILLNQRLVKDDMFTSVHIERYETEARDAKMGAEEITRELPNTNEETVKNLDRHGIIKIGAEVQADDILVGKIAPKGQVEETGASRLISQIFGTKADTVKDVSLKLPHGESGTVVDVKIFSRFKYICENPDCRQIHEFSKKPADNETKTCERCGAPLQDYNEYLKINKIKDAEKLKDADELSAGVNQLVRVYIAQKRKIMQGDKMAGRHGNKGVISNILPECDMPYLPDGTPVDIVLNPLGVPSRMNIGQILETHQGIAGEYLGVKFKNPIFQGSREAEIIADLIVMTNLKKLRVLKEFAEELDLAGQADLTEEMIAAAEKKAVENLESMTADNIKTDASEPIDRLYRDTLENIKKYLRSKEITAEGLELFSQKIGGDPVLPADRCESLSRLTQLRYRLGLISEKPADEITASEKEEKSLLETEIKKTEKTFGKAKVPEDYDYDKLIGIIDETVCRRVGFKAEMAKTDLYDGRTGEKMEQPVAVGVIYMLKLSHLVDDKIHARATGPYSLVTQQPLGGKAQFGGQRFGEMEVWALEAYGAAYTLQEILTIKSDDVTGRVKAFESIVKGRTLNDPGVPESFKILVNELQALCLKVTVEDVDKNTVDLHTNEESSKDFYNSFEYAFGK